MADGQNMNTDNVLIDMEEGLSRVLGNKTLYIKLLVKFKAEPYLNNLTDALDSGDYENAQAAAHTVKGVAANLSLKALHLQAQEIEAQIKNKAVNPDMIESVKNCYNETLISVNKVIEQNG